MITRQLDTNPIEFHLKRAHRHGANDVLLKIYIAFLNSRSCNVVKC